MTKEEIGAVLKQLRISSGMTQTEVAKKIGRNQPIIGHWETGYAQPDANTLFILCDIYGTTVDKAFGFSKNHDAFSPSEIEHIKKYRSLDPTGKSHVDTMLDWEAVRSANLLQKDTRIADLEKEQFAPTRFWAYYGKIACAGAGFIFDDIPTTVIEAPPADADFIIGVSGDSMDPDYHDGEKLYVKKTEDIPYGEVGIFTIRNECFLKEYREGGLVSRNPKYADIPGDENVRLIGKVVGKVDNE